MKFLGECYPFVYLLYSIIKKQKKNNGKVCMCMCMMGQVARGAVPHYKIICRSCAMNSSVLYFIRFDTFFVRLYKCSGLGEQLPCVLH